MEKFRRDAFANYTRDPSTEMGSRRESSARQFARTRVEGYNIQFFVNHPRSSSRTENMIKAIEQMSKTKKDVNKARELEPRAGQLARCQV